MGADWEQAGDLFPNANVVSVDAAFRLHAEAWFSQHGIIITRVLTDDGGCYRSRDFTTALGPKIAHKRDLR